MALILILLYNLSGDFMYKKYLKDNTCFIVPNNIKKEILLYVSSNKLLLDLSFYTVEELKKNIFFDYNEKTIYFLAKEYNFLSSYPHHTK